MKLLFTSEEIVECCQGKYYSRNLGQHLKKYKYLGNIICVCYYKDVSQSPLPEIDTKGVEFFFCKKENSISTLLSVREKNKQIIKQCLFNADALICHIPSSLSVHAININKHQKLNKPCIGVVVGCVWDSMWNYDWRGKLIALPMYFQMRAHVRNLPYAIYVTKEFLQSRYPCNGYTEYASNVCIYQYDEEILQSRLKRIEMLTDTSEYRIVTVAAIDVKYKGQQYVIQALNLLNNSLGCNYHYYIVGGGDKTYLQDVAQKEHVEKYVHFLGALPNNKVIDVLDHMDIYIQPSKQEGLPRALIEAMSRGMPAIGSNIAGIPELLPKQCLFSKGSVKEITSILYKINKQAMIKLAHANFKAVEEYKIENINKRRELFFDKFCGQYFLNNNIDESGI